MGQAFIVEGDRTSHGGTVIEGSAFSFTGGRKMVRNGDHVYCPRCKSTTVIICNNNTLIVDGAAVALDGDRTSCGAILISSQSATSYHGYGGNASSASSAQSEAVEENAVEDKQHDEQFLLNDGAGRPLSNSYYTAKLSTGELVHGVTDENGKTERYATNSAHQIEIHIGHQDNS